MPPDAPLLVGKDSAKPQSTKLRHSTSASVGEDRQFLMILKINLVHRQQGLFVSIHRQRRQRRPQIPPHRPHR
jgi:hypothetical protein